MDLLWCLVHCCICEEDRKCFGITIDLLFEFEVAMKIGRKSSSSSVKKVLVK